MVEYNTTILAIDPGDVYFGLVLYYNNQVQHTEQFYAAGCYIQVIEKLEELIAKNPNCSNCIIIVENFLKYGHKANIQHYTENTTSQMIGSIILWAQLNKYTVVKQNASQAKIWTDNRLLRVGIIEKHKNTYQHNNHILLRHTRDAFRHLIYFLNKHKFNGCISSEKLKDR